MNKEESSKSRLTKIIILASFFGIALLLVILIILLIMALMMGRTRSVSPHVTNTFEYKFFQLDPSNDEYSVGFVTLDTFIGEGEFESDVDEDGHLSLISNFGSSQYLVTGSCSCGGNIESAKGLIAASNEYSANLKSSEELEKICSSKFEGRCDISNIETTVDSMGILPGGGDSEFARFMCEGNCIVNPYQNFKELTPVAEAYPCEDYKKTATVKIHFGVKTMEQLEMEAKEKFVSEEMMGYCKKAGKYRFSAKFETLESNTNSATSTEYLCYDGYIAENSLNPSIHCVQR